MRSGDWLPVSRDEMLERGWETADVIIVSGDAYVDHPGFGHAMIGRVLERLGLKVAILPQPNWRDDLRDFKKLGKPRLFFGVTAGAMDSMVNHYTAFRRLRSDDAYTPGGKAGFRPDYASLTYTRILKQLYPDVPVVLGGVEASLRRTTHYDYWSESIKSGILEESGADYLVFGMGEQAVRQLTLRLMRSNELFPAAAIPQLAYMVNKGGKLPETSQWTDLELPSHEECLASKKNFAKHFMILEENSNRLHQRRLLQKSKKGLLVINPASDPPGEKDADAPYELPYTRLPHPRYQKRGAVPAWEMIKFSVNIHRGCFGGCSFCTISAHQGKFIVSRSEKSILAEVEKVTEMPGFKGHVSDLGGPSANMYRMQGRDLKICRKCRRPSCIFPDHCKNLITDHQPLTSLYQKANAMKAVRKISIGSGIRYDMLVNKAPAEDIANGYTTYIRRLVGHHVSGRLKIAPEHTVSEVLRLMRKPSFKSYHAFQHLFYGISQQAGLKQEIVPYFISSHPGCKAEHMAELAAETKSLGMRLEQVQDFTPTPMTLSSVMYYCGFDPYSNKKVHLARSMDQKAEQNRFFFWYLRENRNWVLDQCRSWKRADLLKIFSGKQ